MKMVVNGEKLEENENVKISEVPEYVNKVVA